MNLKKKIINIFLTQTINSKNITFFFSLYILVIIIANYIYCYLFINKFPEIVTDNNIYVLKNLGFNFGQIMHNLNQNGEFKANYFNVDFYVSRMPALPLILNFLYENITKNFFIIHLIKNIFFLSLIFFLLKNIFNKHKLIYFLSGLAVLIYNPHNLWTSLSFNFEEGILNYLIVILTLLFFSSLKYRYCYLSLTICGLFFLKSSMFFLSLVISVFFFFDNSKNKLKFLPLLLLIISNLIWGLYSYKKTNYFAFGSNLVSYNYFTLNHAYNHQFNGLYPKISPDILTKQLVKKLPPNFKKNEWEINKFYFDQSKNFFLENPREVITGVIKKLNVIFLFPYKDSQIPDLYGNVDNSLRFSNIPNKLIFLLFLIALIINLFKERSKENIFMVLLVSTYFFPYVVGFVYTRHCTSIYMIAGFYLLYNFIKAKELK